MKSSRSSIVAAGVVSRQLSLIAMLAVLMTACTEADMPAVVADTIPTPKVDSAAVQKAAGGSSAVEDAAAAAGAADVSSQAAADSKADSAVTAPEGTATKYKAGQDPNFAVKMGWPTDGWPGPAPLPGAILPNKRIIAYYGNPLSKRMGVLGEYETEEMLRRFDVEIAKWNKADPSTPVQPALHMVTVVADGHPGSTGKYRTIMRDTLVEKVYSWGKSRNAIMFIDIQVGHSDIRELLPKFDHFLTRPDFHLAVDPEFYMREGVVPGRKIGTMHASDINYVTGYLAELVRKHDLPPKVLVIHRFTRGMVTNSQDIKLRPEVQVVMHMDGWGAPWLKRDSYRDYIVKEPVQFTGFKLFYHNDTKKGDPLMQPEDLLKLRPKPLYIQYQ